MKADAVVKALKKSALDLLSSADMLAGSDPERKKLKKGEGWYDGYGGEAYCQHALLEDTINWLQCRHSALADTVRNALTRLDDQDEKALFNGDCTKYPVAAFRARRPFVEEMRRASKEFTAIAEYIAEMEREPSEPRLDKLVTRIDTVLHIGGMNGKPTRGERIVNEVRKRQRDGMNPIEVCREIAREDYEEACKKGTGRWLCKAKSLAVNKAWVRGEQPSHTNIEMLAQTLKRERNRALAIPAPKANRARPRT